MTGFKVTRAMIMLDKNDRPIGFKLQNTGDEFFFPTFGPDGQLMRADGTDLPMGAAQVQADWAALAGSAAAILNKPSIPSGAYPDLTSKPSFAIVAFSGDYADLKGKPPLMAVAVSGNYSDLNGRPSLAAVAVSGDYGDLANKPTIPAAAAAVAQTAVTRSLNTIFQPNPSRNVLASYSVQAVLTASIASGQDGDLVLEIASNPAFTANVQTISVAGSSQIYSLAVAIQGVQKAALQVTGLIPAGYYARLRTVSTTGAPVFTYRAGQEIQL